MRKKREKNVVQERRKVERGRGKLSDAGKIRQGKFKCEESEGKEGEHWRKERE